MFIIRGAFWLGVGVLLLPSDERQQAKMIGAATTTIERVTTFCDRNASLCQKGGDAWTVFVRKAEFAIKLASDVASERGAKKGDGTSPLAATPAEPVPAQSQGGIPQSKVRTEVIAPTKTSTEPSDIESLLRDVGA